jgi:hypothetical protein
MASSKPPYVAPEPRNRPKSKKEVKRPRQLTMDLNLERFYQRCHQGTNADHPIDKIISRRQDAGRSEEAQARPNTEDYQLQGPKR